VTINLPKLKPDDWGPATVLIVLIVVVVAVVGGVQLITDGQLSPGFEDYANKMIGLALAAAGLGGARAIHGGAKALADAHAVHGSGTPSDPGLDFGDNALSDDGPDDVPPGDEAAAAGATGPTLLSSSSGSPSQ
jgi:hypothetical protein